MSSTAAATLYVGINILIVLVLVFLVIRQRRAFKCVIGDGGHLPLMLAIRAHANAIETIPLGLIGLLALASVGAQVWTVHSLGIMLTLGRVLHAYGLSNNQGTSFGRMAGMLLTLMAILLIGVACVLAIF
jgi:uncharacterized protein